MLEMVPLSFRGGNKLRTYCTFKQDYGVEKYCKCIMPKNHRSALCKFRCGVAPLRIETGRHEGLPIDRRICPCCNINVIEYENHVLLNVVYIMISEIHFLKEL